MASDSENNSGGAEIVVTDKGVILNNTFSTTPEIFRPLPPPLMVSDRDAKFTKLGQVGQGGQVGQDTAVEPYWYEIVGSGMDKSRIGSLRLAQYMVPPPELYAASFTPKGSFITRIVPRHALRNGWKFVPEKKSKEPLSTRLHKRLTDLTRIWKLKAIFTSAITTSEIFSRSLLYRRQVAPRGQVQRWELFVTRIPDAWVQYNEETNEIEKYMPIVGWGRGQRMLEIDPKDAILFISEKDPFGNGFQGIPQLLSSYRTIVRSENIEESWADIVANRGMGLIDIEIAGADTEEKLKPWAKKYGNPQSYHVLVHNERMKVKAEEGLKASFDLDQTISRYTKDISSATGFPSMRMEGVQTGTVTGSEVDKDSMAEGYASIQERYEDAMMATYYMLDPWTGTQRWEMEFEFDLKLDIGKKSSIFATDSNSVMTVQEIITVNQALEKLGLPALEGEDGQIMIAQYIDKQASLGTRVIENVNYMNQEEIKAPLGPDDPVGGPPQEAESGDSKSLSDWILMHVTSISKPKRTEILTDSLHRMEIARDLSKEELGTILAKVENGADRLSNNEINYILRENYGSGKSPNWIGDQRRGR